MQVMKGDRFRPAVLTPGRVAPQQPCSVCNPKVTCRWSVCESGTHCLAPIMMLQVNIITCGGSGAALPERVPGRIGQGRRNIASLHGRGKNTHRFRPGVGSFPWQCRPCPYVTRLASNHAPAARASTPGPNHDVASQCDNATTCM